MGLCCYTAYIYYGLGVVAFYAGYLYLKKYIEQRKWDQWSNTPKDVVILHGFPAYKVVPNPSPFVLKLQTYLRLAKIPHKLDHKDWFGPKGKAPWITLNGQHIGDSQFIIDFLGKKFDVSFKGSYSDEQLAISTAVRLMLEEHLFWGAALERFAFSGHNLHKIRKGGPVTLWLMQKVMSYLLKQATWKQGIGRHSHEEIVSLLTTDLRAVSKILGSKKFILGDEPCEDDCGIFGNLAQIVWALPDSPYEKLVNEELVNLKEYCYRMKDRCYPGSEWDELLDN